MIPAPRGLAGYHLRTSFILREVLPSADIVISPQKGAMAQKANEFFRNRNILEVKCHGHMEWQKRRNYGKPNHSELAIQRYKRIFGLFSVNSFCFRTL